METYRPSMFNIVQKTASHSSLVYNTRTTSVVQVDDGFYQSYFTEGISQEDETVRQLVSMGFLVPVGCNELEELKALWRRSLTLMGEDLTSLLIAPTMQCNAQCYYCFERTQDADDKAGADERCKSMDQQKQDALVKFIERECTGKHLGIHWFGGEPLMAQKQISYLTEELQKRGISVYSHVTTNGSLITEELLQVMKNQWNVQKLQITIDGIGPEYNAIKNYKGGRKKDYFSIVLDNIRKALSMGIRVNLRVNFDPDHLEASVRTIEYLIAVFHTYENCFLYAAPITDRNVTAVTEHFDTEVHPYYQLMKLTEKYKRFRFSVVAEDGDEIYTDMYNETVLPIRRKSTLLLKNNYLQPIPLPCMAVTKQCYAVDPEGYLYRCHRLLGRKNAAVGFLEDSGQVRLQGEMADYFDKVCFPYEECSHCSVAPLCLGGCKANRLLYEKPQVCCHVKAIVNELILDYVRQMQS